MTHRRSDQGVAGGDILRGGRAHLAGAAVDGRDHGALSCRRQSHQRGILARCLHHKQRSAEVGHSLPSRTLQRRATLYGLVAFPTQFIPRLLPMPLMWSVVGSNMLATPNNGVVVSDDGCVRQLTAGVSCEAGYTVLRAGPSPGLRCGAAPEAASELPAGT